MKRKTSPPPAPDLDYRYGWIGAAAAMSHLGLRPTKTGDPAALYRLIKQHGLPHGRMGGKYRFRRADLDAWMQANQNALVDTGHASASVSAGAR